MPPYYIYKLVGQSYIGNTYYYIGSTPNPKRRLRQHCGFISGGAKCTSSKLNVLKHDPYPWSFKYIILTFFPKNMALSFEWQMKMPFSLDGQRKRHTRYSKNIDEMLMQIDLVIKYTVEKYKPERKQMFMLVDDSVKILYMPTNFILLPIRDLTDSVMENELINMFNELN